MESNTKYPFVDYLRKIRTTKPRLEFEAKELKVEVTRRASKAEREFVNRADFTRSTLWIILRTDVLEGKENLCRCCGSDGVGQGGLNVDHKRNRRDYPETALLWSNLQILCGVCNKGKGNRYNTDWEQRRAAREGEPFYTPLGDVLAEFIILSPEWDRDELLRKYRRFQRKSGETVHNPDKAFLGWVRKVTKGLPPPPSAATRRGRQAQPRGISTDRTTRGRRPFGKPQKPR